jgi:hypothetical protein
VVSLIIYVVGISRVKSIIWGDSLYYYAYTRSIVLDQDINFANEAFDFELGFPNTVQFSLKSGRIVNKFSPGTGLLWIPGMVLGQAFSFLGNLIANNEVFVMDGTGVVPQFFVAILAVLFSVVGLYFVYQTLLLWFNKNLAGWSMLVLFLTTPIFYYTAIDPVNSHSASFLFSSLLFYLVSKMLKFGKTWKQVILMGLVAGVLVLIRNQDAVVALPVLIPLIFANKEALINKINWLILYAGSAFLILAIQIYTTITLYGVLGSPYIMSGEKINWLNPDFIRVLFTPQNGLFFFSPILLFSLLFIFKKLFIISSGIKRQNLLSTPLFYLLLITTLTFFLQLYVVASWGREILGGPYGSRMFVSVLPHLGIGIAFLITDLQNKFKNKFNIMYFSLILLLFINMLSQTFWMLYRF